MPPVNKNSAGILRMFTVMRERVCAGEDWRRVLADYGLSMDRCKGKTHFATQAQAILSACKSLRKSSRDTNHFRPYHCQGCGQWHLTKMRREGE